MGGRSCEFDMSEAQRLCSAQLGSEIALAMHAVTEKLLAYIRRRKLNDIYITSTTWIVYWRSLLINVHRLVFMNSY